MVALSIFIESTFGLTWPTCKPLVSQIEQLGFAGLFRSDHFTMPWEAHPDVLELIEQKMLTRGDKNNRIYVGETVKIDEDVSAEMQSALYDPQTAGGLLISLPAERAESFLNEIGDAKIIGRVAEKKEYLIEVT